jgi:hypothetical protein
MTDEERRELEALRSDLQDLEQGVRQLTTRLHALERAAGDELPEGSAAEPGPVAPAPEPQPRLRGPSWRRRNGAPRPPRQVTALERWLRSFFSQGNPLNKLGALSLVVGAAIVFKYAVDNGWIGPTGRVALGLLAGSAVLACGELYARRGWQAFASGLVAAGDGLLFVTVYFGHQQYEVIPAALAFGLYVVVTAAVVAQSLRYDSVGLASWGLLGGYLAPALASTGSGNYVFLSTYLLVLNGGVFAIAFRRSWLPLKWMAFLLTVLYTGTWVWAYAERPGDTRWLELQWLLPYLSAFFLSFAAIPAWRSLRLREPIDAFGQLLTVANGVVHFGFAVVALRAEHHAWLGLVAAVVAVLYAVVSSRVTRQPETDAKSLRVFTGTAAAFLLLATPYLASGPSITLVWCAQTVFLAWACTQPRFAFLQLHVLAMLAIILVRLVEFDGIQTPHWGSDGERYIPFAQLRSWPPFAAALTFALTARFTQRMPSVRIPVPWVLGIGLLVLVAAVDGEAGRTARLLLAPGASSDLQNLLRAGLLVAVMCAMWFGAATALAGAALPWAAGLGLLVILGIWTFDALVWPGGYGSMRRVLGDGYALWWLHGGVLLLAPLLLLLAWLWREAPERALRLSHTQLQTVLFGAALLIAMLLLRREVFAITHAPPFMDLFPSGARRASYRAILSVCYALLAFGVYLNAVRTGSRSRLHAAYALYIFTAFKVYVFDLESQNQLYRAFSLMVFAAILFVSSYFANRQQAGQQKSQHA